ncbi:MAG: hypothetical protein MJY43_03725 [Bacteroidales bacterium]|nr:hypothetical protein [Bacteroidales bacterium]
MTRYDFMRMGRDTDEFLSRIQELGIVDITRSVKAVDEKSAAMLEEADGIKKRIAWLSKENWMQDEEYASIRSGIAASRQAEEELSHWGEFDPEAIKRLSENGTLLTFYCTSLKKFKPQWSESYALQVIDKDEAHVWYVIAGSTEGFPETAVSAPSTTAAMARKNTAELQAQLDKRVALLKAEDIEALRREYASKLSEIDWYFASKATENAAEQALTVVTGFAPSDDDAALRKEFDAMDIYYLASDASAEDNPPIKLRNNKFVRMFEVLTDMYGRPLYNEFDPTPFISIFFLLFFAMCMGDAGYGIILIIAGQLLKKVKSFAKLAPLVVTLGAGTFVVGFLFHTFFSIDISQWACIPTALKKIMVPATVATYDGTMVLALIVGIVHLCLAMIVKTVYATRNKGFLNSLGTWGWTLLIVGGIAVGAFALAGVIDAALTKIVIIALGCLSAIGIFLLNDLHRNPLKNIGSGLWEAYNTATGLLGDVLSYLRLYALGLAGSMLGFAFNDLAKMALGDGGVNWIFFILIVIIGHTLNIAMAALGAFVHPLRLNFLEFFKNSDYQGTGRKYNPLKNN